MFSENRIWDCGPVVDKQWGPFVDCHDMPFDFTLRFEEAVFGAVFSVLFTTLFSFKIFELRGTPFKTLPSSTQIFRLVRMLRYCVIGTYDSR
jgi:hypothetical protein